MNTRNVIKNSDPIRHDDLRGLARQAGPTVSVVIPTRRGGAETLSASKQLRPLLDVARQELVERYPDVDADAVLAPIQSLSDADRFWQEQADGLVVFTTPNGSRQFRVDGEFTPQVTVGDHPNLRPVLLRVTEDLEFLLLAVSKSKVRLFAADRATITELPLGQIPASTEEIEVYTKEPHLQFQRGFNAPGHGHESGEENVVSAFLREVGKAVESRFSGDGRPMVLAAVNEHRSGIADQLHNVALLEEIVAGSPDERSDLQLHQKAWPIVAAENVTRHEALVERLNEALGTGLATNDPALISQDSAAGRVDTLVLAQRALTDEARAEDLDAAIANTLLNRGRIDVVEELPGGHAAGAVFRF